MRLGDIVHIFRTSGALIVAGAVVVSLALMAGTWWNLSSTLDGPLVYVGRLTDLTQEGNLGAWFSSVLLLLISVTAFGAALVERELAGRRWTRGVVGWLVIALAFLALSWDEHAAFHERIGQVESLNLSGGRLTDWVGVFVPPLLAFLAFMALFLWRRFRGDVTSLALFIGGALLYVTVPLQEEVETRLRWRSGEAPEAYERPVHLAVLEESTELFAALCLLIAFWRFVVRPRATLDLGAPTWPKPPSPWLFLAGAWTIQFVWTRWIEPGIGAREYLSPGLWVAAASAMGAAFLLWTWTRRESASTARLSAGWGVALLVFTLVVAADYGAALTMRSLAGHAVGSVVVAAAMSVSIVVLAARWFVGAGGAVERGDLLLWALALIAALWTSGGMSSALAAFAFTALANALLLRRDWGPTASA